MSASDRLAYVAQWEVVPEFGRGRSQSWPRRMQGKTAREEQQPLPTLSQPQLHSPRPIRLPPPQTLSSLHHLTAHTTNPSYLHFQVTPAPSYHSVAPPLATPIPLPSPARALRAPPRPGTAQWVNCDIRNFDFSVLGQ